MRWLPIVLLAACTGSKPNDSQDTDSGDDTTLETGETNDTSDTDIPNTDIPSYEFDSRFTDGSSVAYDGQIFRQLLIVEMKNHLGELTERLDTGFFPEPTDIRDELDFYFRFDSETSGEIALSFQTDPETLQTTFNEISSGKDLVGKIAGNDPVGQHKDWTSEFVGWDHPSVNTPESLVWHWFEKLDAASILWANGTYPLDPLGAPVPAVYITAEGQDLRELLQKFLLGAVAFSQGTDDYLDDATEGKGLLSDNTVAETDQSYTALEHAWDEGFGYFGAARNYGSLSDDTVANIGWSDTWNEDDATDLLTEVSWGHSTNAAKRDLGSADSAPTDFTAQAWEGFWQGRQLITETNGALSEEQLNELRGYRDQAISAWEKAIAATVIHYINDVLKDMALIETDEYNFADHAKHWSELKGFSLSFQFNPHSPISDEDFVLLHELLGMAPVLSEESELNDYRDDLLDARSIIADAHGFDDVNIGDENGENGW